ncbi:TolC family protein [Sulfurimonas sp.]|uniref:TolC family protein n=1 Tax=Sulfurimonas sp. TaxID=2022749 RepID=UPI002621905C|nr:TolC family protein [Sulfurimonas sp.]
MKKSLVIFLFLSSTLFAKEVSLEYIFKHASKNALSLKMKQLEASIEASGIESAESGYYPTFNVVYNTEYTESLDGIPLGSESVGGITISNGTRYQSSAALQMNYNLYNFGATNKEVLAAKLSTKAKIKEQCLQEQRLYEQILEKYTDALKLQKDEKYKKEMLSVRKELYRAKERLYRAGQYSKVDLGDEAINIISLERDIENALMQYKQDIIKLSELSYMPLDVQDRLVSIVIDNNIITFVSSFETTAQARMLKNQIEAKKAQISLQIRKQLPLLTMYGNYYFYASNPKEYDYPIRHMRQKSWNIGFSIRFNLFNGFKDNSQSKRLSLELQKLQQQFNDAKHSFTYENKSKIAQISELSVLENKDEKLLDENKNKLAMIKRLRIHQTVDLLAEFNARYELLERTLNLEKRKIDRASTVISLEIANRGEKQCTQH